MFERVEFHSTQFWNEKRNKRKHSAITWESLKRRWQVSALFRRLQTQVKESEGALGRTLGRQGRAGGRALAAALVLCSPLPPARWKPGPSLQPLPAHCCGGGGGSAPSSDPCPSPTHPDDFSHFSFLWGGLALTIFF